MIDVATPDVRPRADSRGKQHSKHTDFHKLLQEVLEKLHKDPLHITAEDARRLHENVDATDQRSARIISAIESLAVANQDLNTNKLELDQVPHISLLTIAEDFLAAVDANPQDVTQEVLKLAQNIVSKCQKAIGHSNAPHPELEAELQKECAKLAPKVKLGVVTKEEADHLHSLEARAHGHTEKGGLTAAAQSVAAKRERQTSLSDSNSLEAELQDEFSKIELKVRDGTVTKGEVDYLRSLETRGQSHTEKGGLTAQGQSVVAKHERKSMDECTMCLPLSDSSHEDNVG